MFEGATFNLAHNLTQMLYFRPHNRFGRNVYLVGGGTHPGSGLPVIYEGARITARLLLEDRGAAGSSAGSRSLPQCPIGESASRRAPYETDRMARIPHRRLTRLKSQSSTHPAEAMPSAQHR